MDILYKGWPHFTANRTLLFSFIPKTYNNSLVIVKKKTKKKKNLYLQIFIHAVDDVVSEVVFFSQKIQLRMT